MPSLSSSNEPINWITDALAVDLSRCPRRNPRALLYYQALFPFCEDYFAKPSPCFLMNQPEKLWMVKNREVLARDGAYPLLSFFYNTRPIGGGFMVWIHEALANLVPSEWRDHCGLYRFHTKIRFGVHRKPKKFVFGGVVSPTFSTEEELSNQASVCAELWGQDWRHATEISIFFPFGPHCGLEPASAKSHWQFSQSVARTLGTDVKVLNYTDLRWLRFDQEAAYIEVNNRRAVASSYLEQLMFSRGAGSITELEPRSVQRTIPLSPYHDVELFLPTWNTSFTWPSPEEIRWLQTSLETSLQTSLYKPSVETPWEPWIECLEAFCLTAQKREMDFCQD